MYHLLFRNGVIAIAAAVSPYRETREVVRRRTRSTRRTSSGRQPDPASGASPPGQEDSYFSKTRHESQHALDFIDAHDNFVKSHGDLHVRAPVGSNRRWLIA